MISGEAALVRGVVARPGTWRGRRPPVRQLADALLRGDIGEAGMLAERFLGRVRSAGEQRTRSGVTPCRPSSAASFAAARRPRGASGRSRSGRSSSAQLDLACRSR